MSNQTTPDIYLGKIQTSLVGLLWVAVTEKGLFAVEFGGTITEFTRKLTQRTAQATIIHNSANTTVACQQISEYLHGERQVFDLAIDLCNIPAFQQKVLTATLAIPYGQTATYAEIAQAVGRPHAARAVGRAEATNPIPLVVPCHRVIGSDGKLHGYGGPGGITLKARLLELERTNLYRVNQT